MKVLKKLSVILICLSAVVGAQAQSTTVPSPQGADGSGKAALSADFGSLGYGATLWYTFGPRFTLSIGYNFLSYDYHDIDVDSGGASNKFAPELSLKNLPIALNWHPFKGAFRLFGGAVIANNRLDIIGKPNNGTYVINGKIYTSAQIGTLFGEAKFPQGVRGLAGFGWSQSPVKGGWGYFLDAGVMLSGSPKVSLDITGPIKSDPQFASELRAAEQDANDDLASFKIYPVVRAGLMYRF